jgi:hypothetical protein
MNCNPVVKGKTAVGDSCFTPDVLAKLKTSYNKHHPETPIRGSRPQKVWIELKDRMSKCSKEDCWLNVIDDPAERKKIDEYVFAPDHPDEWKRDPNAWLSNFDIVNVLKQYERKYANFKIIGPTPIDFDSRGVDDKTCVWQELCTFSVKHMVDAGKTKIGVVFNLSKSTEDGTHWVSLFIDLDEHFIFFFDSTGASIPAEIEVLVNRVRKQAVDAGLPELEYLDNRGIEHQKSNTECGMYSLFFVITLLTGEMEGGRKLSTRTKKINFFRKTIVSDKFVGQYRKKYFNERQ